MLTAATQQQPAFGAGEMLAALLGVEALLLAAVAIGVSLAAASGIGNDWVVSPAAFAYGTTFVLALITIGAAFVWAKLFTASAWPSGIDLRAGAVALALAIVTPPIISLVLAINLSADGE